jgi:hypothetical protein
MLNYYFIPPQIAEYSAGSVDVTTIGNQPKIQLL